MSFPRLLRKQVYSFIQRRGRAIFVLSVLLGLFFSLLPGIAHADFCDYKFSVGGLDLFDTSGICEIKDSLSKVTDPVDFFREIFNALIAIPLALILLFPAGILYFIAAILGTLFTAASSVMLEFIQAAMEIGVTPDKEEFVRQGFEITRNFANIVFLLILAFIGLATSLRLQTYQAQKTLPMLILIALLVNFSPVLVGFFTDMGNLLTNAFLGGITGLDGFGLLGDQLKIAGANFLELPTKIFNDPETVLPTVIDLITRLVVATLYYLLAWLVVFIIMVVFFVRTIVLWILTILAPLAFAAYILPTTRQLWSQWFKNLIQWAFIGVPISFFLLLAGMLQGLKTPAQISPLGPDQIGPLTIQVTEGIVPEDPSLLANLIVSVTGNFAVLLLMAVGIFVSMQFVPQGAQGAIDFGKKWGMRTAGAAGTAAWRFRGVGKYKLKEGIGQTFEAQGERLRKFGERMGMSPNERTTKQAELGTEIKRKEQEYSDSLGGQYGDPMSTENIAKRAKLAGEVKDLKEEEKSYGSQKGGKLVGAGAFLARWAGRAVELPAGEVQRRTAAKDQREIAEGTAEGTGKDSRDLARQINQELAKGALKDQNRIVGLLNAMVKNNDSDDLQAYMRNGLLDSKQIGAAIADALRGGSPTYRPLMKAVYGRMLSNPDQFGENFAAEKYKQGDEMPQGKKVGDIKRQADGITPVLIDKMKQGWVNEVVEKLSAADITSKILGDTLDKGKAGGREFVEHGGEQVVKLLVSVRGQLSGPLLTRPESQEGRKEVGRVIMETVNEALRTYDQEKQTNLQAAAQKLSDKLIGGLGPALASLAGPGAQNAGISFPGGPGEVRNFNRAIAAQVAGQQPLDIKHISNIVDGVRDAANALARQTTGAARGETTPREGYRGGIG